MVKATEKMNDVVNELTDLTMAKFDRQTLSSLDVDDFKMIQATVKLMEAWTEVAAKTAEVMDEQNKKLDELLDRTRKGSH